MVAKKVDLQERLNMRFLTVSYKEKQVLIEPVTQLQPPEASHWIF